MILRQILRAPDEGAGGGGEDAPEQPTYFSQFSPEFRESDRARSLYKYAKPEDLATAVLDGEERSARSIVIPDSAKPDEGELKAFRTALGLPDDADGYEIKAPKEHEELVKFVREKAFDMRLGRGQAQRMYELFAGAAKGTTDAQATAKKEAADTFGDRLLEAVGKDEGKRDATVNLFKTFLVKRVGNEDTVKRIAESGLLHDPGFAVAMAGVESAMGEAPMIAGGDSGQGGTSKSQGHFGNNYSPEFQAQHGKGAQ